MNIGVYYFICYLYSLIIIRALAGNVNNSAQLRLKYGQTDDDNILNTHEDSITNTVEEMISNLVELAAGDDGLIDLRGA